MVVGIFGSGETGMGEIRFCCKGCGAKLQVAQAFVGRQAKCPKCGQSSAVTAETPKAVESLLTRARQMFRDIYRRFEQNGKPSQS